MADIPRSPQTTTRAIILPFKIMTGSTAHTPQGIAPYQERRRRLTRRHLHRLTRRDQLQRRVFDELPTPEDAKHVRLGDIPNPVVKRTLTELRKVVKGGRFVIARVYPISTRDQPAMIAAV